MDMNLLGSGENVDADSVSLGWDLRSCMFSQFLSDADVAGLQYGPTFYNQFKVSFKKMAYFGGKKAINQFIKIDWALNLCIIVR